MSNKPIESWEELLVRLDDLTRLCCKFSTYEEERKDGFEPYRSRFPRPADITLLRAIAYELEGKNLTPPAKATTEFENTAVMEWERCTPRLMELIVERLPFAGRTLTLEVQHGEIRLVIGRKPEEA